MSFPNEKLKEKFPEENLEFIEYQTTKKPCKIKCLNCGTIYSYKQGGTPFRPQIKYLCKNCKKKQDIKNRFIQSLNDRFPDEKDTYEILEFSTTQKPCKIKCLKCGYVAEYKQACSVYSKIRLCPNCAKNTIDKRTQKTIKEFVSFIQNNDKWELITKPEDITNASQLIECKCKACGKISLKSMRDYVRNIQCQCYREQTTLVQLQELLNKEGYSYIGKDQQFFNRTERIFVKCNKCDFKYSITLARFLQGGNRCPKCYKIKSNGEIAIQQWLQKNNIDFMAEYEVIIKGHALRFDFYLPKFDYFIEFQGKQHFEPVEYFGGEQQFLKQQEYDNYKREYTDRLLEIPYWKLLSIDDILSEKFNDH